LQGHHDIPPNERMWMCTDVKCRKIICCKCANRPASIPRQETSTPAPANIQAPSASKGVEPPCPQTADNASKTASAPVNTQTPSATNDSKPTPSRSCSPQSRSVTWVPAPVRKTGGQ
jgi:hypothetical protein